jgi:hypothetical protein
VKKSITNAATILNTVNCSTAPDCVKLNRNDCSTTPGSCGECMGGHAGESGHRNSYCAELSEISRHLIGTRSTGICTFDSDCNPQRWEICSSGQCLVRPKECLNDCSLHGLCVYVSTFDENIVVNTCSVLDLDCDAICKCSDGYRGLSCDTELDEFVQTRSTRHKLVVAIESMSLKQDATKDAVISWLRGLSSVSNNPSGLLPETKILMSQMSVRYLSLAVSVGLSSEDVASVRVIIDLVSDKTSKELVEASSALLAAYTGFISYDMAEGQRDIKIISDSFRSITASISSSSALSLSIPVTPLEGLVGGTSQSASLPPQSQQSGAYKASITESKGASTNRTLYSVPL